MEIQNYFSKRRKVSQKFASPTKKNWMKLTYVSFFLSANDKRDITFGAFIWLKWSKLCLNCYFTITLQFTWF